jgi:hypothetical protein
MVNNITNHNNTNNSFCPLLFEVGQKELFVLLWLVILLTIVVWGRTEGVICIVVVGYIENNTNNSFCPTSNNTGQQYNQPQQYK